MKKTLLFLLIVATISGCNRHVDFPDLFSREGMLDYTIIEDLPDYLTDYPIRMLKAGDKFIISYFKGDMVFVYFDVTTGKSFQFGKRGKGPGEFNDGYGLAKISDSTFIAYDRVLKKVSYFKIAKDSVINYKVAEVPPIYNIYPYNDSVFVTNGNIPFDKNYGVLDLPNNIAYSYIDFPPMDKDLPKPVQLRAYYSHVVRRPGTNVFIGFKTSHHIIDVLTLDGLSLKLEDRKQFNLYDWEMSKNVPVPKLSGSLHLFTAKISGSDNRAYACYKVPNDNISEWSILAFDWEGNPKERYNIPFKPYTIVCSDNRSIYTIAVINERYELIKFDLPDKSNLQ